jgi:tRNA-dihydrouridine synthase 1
MSYNLDSLKSFLALPEPYKCPTCPYCNGTKDPTPKYQKTEPWKWWNEQLKAPKYAVAPMVDASELPFRMLCRKYGATLAYTPMFHSLNFSNSQQYRDNQFSTCPEDRPLFVQFCGNDAEIVLKAAQLVEDKCDAVDLNLGCPQGIAKKGNYGSFLMEKWDVVHTILHTLSVELKIPVTAKMRVFDDLELTLRYARMLRDTGIHVLAVHGRTREMKGQQTGLADLSKVAAVKKEITNIPVLENGNILQYSDIAVALEKTKCDAVLSAEALLWDPRLFANVPDYVLTGRGFVANKVQRLAGVKVAKEYLQLVFEKYPTCSPIVKSHLFKMVHHSFDVHPEMRVKMGQITTEWGEKQAMEKMKNLIMELEKVEEASEIDLYSKKEENKDNKNDDDNTEEDKNKPLPGCRKLAADPDYESQVDGALGCMFESCDN